MRLQYLAGDLRDIRLGGTEIVRRIYMVFQDRNWTARPWQITAESIDAGPDSFVIELAARGTFDAEPFTWTGLLTGDAHGTIRYSVTGTTERPFLRNRLGLCVLHPMAETAGRPVTLERVDGSLVETAFPDSIDPDQPFLEMRALTHEVRPGVRASVRMTGETFESEDHRNWSDASFKHYCTPITLPFPVTVAPDDVIAQAVEVRLHGTTALEPDDASTPVVILTDDVTALPALGIQLDHDGHRLTPSEVERLAQLRLHHVRLDLDAHDPVERLDAALADASAIGALLVPAVQATGPLDHLAPYADDPRISHWLVFDPATKVTSPDLVHAACGILGDRVGGGTNLYFTELNRGRPAGPDRIAFSVNPQVHAADDLTVMQNATTQAVIARNARALYPEARLEVSPITLRPRFNPNATHPESDVSSTPLPSRVDARQCTAFTAAWTALSIKALAESGCIDAVTYYEATGWEGLMERAEGSPQPDDFASSPGASFPVYDLLADLAGGTQVRRAVSSRPTVVDALVVDERVHVVNLSAWPQSAIVDGRDIELDPYGIVSFDRKA